MSKWHLKRWILLRSNLW